MPNLETGIYWAPIVSGLPYVFARLLLVRLFAKYVPPKESFWISNSIKNDREPIRGIDLLCAPFAHESNSAVADG